MAVSSPATLISICNELGLTNNDRNFSRAISTTLLNPDFFSGKSKNSLKDWAGYVNVAPTRPFTLIYDEQTGGAREGLIAVAGIIKISVNGTILTFDLATFSPGSMMGVFSKTININSNLVGGIIDGVVIEQLTYRYDYDTAIVASTYIGSPNIPIIPGVYQEPMTAFYGDENYSLGEMGAISASQTMLR